MTMKSFLSALATALFLTACATTGPARNDDLFARVRHGMTGPEVRALLGPPDDAMRYPLSGDTGWGYLYWDGWGFWSEFSVTFGPDATPSRRTRAVMTAATINRALPRAATRGGGLHRRTKRWAAP